jgi:putative transcriptional regulator
MTIQYHPDAATLMSYAAGSLGEALSAVVASHVEMCADCRTEIKRLEFLGALLLERVTPVTAEAPDAARLAQPPAPFANSVRGDGVLPAAIARLIGGGLDRVHWSTVAPGLQQAKLPLSKGSDGHLMLLRIGAGKRVPEHGHGGSELTLVLSGSYSDATGRYGRGDVADLDEDVEHQPVVDRECECICLIASETKAKFKGVLPRLLQPLVGI